MWHISISMEHLFLNLKASLVRVRKNNRFTIFERKKEKREREIWKKERKKERKKVIFEKQKEQEF